MRKEKSRASFCVALEIVKRGKSLSDGEMIKESIIAVTEEMHSENVNLLTTVSLSTIIVARKVENMEIFPLNCPRKMDM